MIDHVNLEPSTHHTLAAIGSPAPNNPAIEARPRRPPPLHVPAITYTTAALPFFFQSLTSCSSDKSRLHRSSHQSPQLISRRRAGRPGAPSSSHTKNQPLAMGRLLLLLGAAMLLLASTATAQDCLSATFSNGRIFSKCNSLLSLSASLHWTYHAENGTADVAFRAPSDRSGWVAWGINPTAAASMGGSSVLVASHDGTGALSVLLTYLEDSRNPSLSNNTLRFNVPVGPAVEYSGGAYTIYATVQLPGNSTQQNTVWQAGPTSSGAIAPHPTAPANLASTLRLDFLSGSSTAASNSKLHRRNIHGLLNAIAWGILIPLGAIIARYLRVFESADPAWFYLHIACQCSGYILGVAGWGLGLKLGSESAGVTYRPHRNIGIAIFSLATLQVLALLLRPDKKNKYRLYWNIYHHAVGYTVIVLSAVNIFKGLDILQPASGYKTAYIVILATLGGIALCLEAITWPIAIRKRRRNAAADKAANGNGNGNGWQQGA